MMAQKLKGHLQPTSKRHLFQRQINNFPTATPTDLHAERDCNVLSMLQPNPHPVTLNFASEEMPDNSVLTLTV